MVIHHPVIVMMTGYVISLSPIIKKEKKKESRRRPSPTTFWP
jgi:hypothetical protein